MSPDLEVALIELERMAACIGADEAPSLIGALERLKAVAWTRLVPPGNGHGRLIANENLSAQDAARRLGVSADWLYKNASHLPFTVRIGRRLLFSANGMERWNRQRQGR